MELERITPEAAGIPSAAIGEMLDQLAVCGTEMHAFMLLRHGKVCAEGSWFPYEPRTPQIVFSFSKSLTSTAVGFAWQEGILSLEEKLVDIFPDKLPAVCSDNLRQVQIKHLLMMGCGHETEIPSLGLHDPDWIAAFLAHPFVFEPGTHFTYNTAGTNLLSAILTKKTGQLLTEFLRPRLLEPLGMSPVTCAALPDGIQMGGAGFSLTIDDMARFTQFLANRGKWEGRQLLKEEWFSQATARQIDTLPASCDPDWQQGYGYQIWLCEPEGAFRGDGAYGQYGVVMGPQNAVLVIQSASQQLQSVLSAVWEKLLPQMADAPLPEDPIAHALLTRRLSRLELLPLPMMRNPVTEPSLEGIEYLADVRLPSMPDLIGGNGKFQPEGNTLLSVSFAFRKKDMLLRCRQDNATLEFLIGLDGHYACATVDGVPYGGNGRWRSFDCLEITLRSTRLVGGKLFLFTFDRDKLTITAHPTYLDAGDLAGPTFPGNVTFTRTKKQA